MAGFSLMYESMPTGSVTSSPTYMPTVATIPSTVWTSFASVMPTVTSGPSGQYIYIYIYIYIIFNCLYGSAKASVTQAVGHGFEPRPDH